MNPNRPAVTRVTTGNEPIKNFPYYGSIMVLEHSKGRGRIRLGNGDVAHFQINRICSCEDKGRREPFLGQLDPTIGSGIEVGTSIVALLGVNSSDELFCLKLTTWIEFARVRRLIQERQAREQQERMVHPLILKFGGQKVTNTPPKRRKGLRPCDVEMANRYRREA